MELTTVEGRVLACLIEKAAVVPESYPLTLNALRLACNQSTGRNPVVAYDDRTIEDTLIALKSKGLVRFVHAGAGARSTRYAHRADERWRLTPVELATLAVLLLRGPQTTAEIRSRAERLCPDGTDDPDDVDSALDTLAGRSPTPLAVRLARRPNEREIRWEQVLADRPWSTRLEEPEDVGSVTVVDQQNAEPAADGQLAAPGDSSPNHAMSSTYDRPATQDDESTSEALRAVESRLASIEARISDMESALREFLG